MTEESRPLGEPDPSKPELPPAILPREHDAEPLEIREFVDTAVAEHLRAELPASHLNIGDPPICWYCAVAEALVWTAGVPAVQIMASIGVSIALMILGFLLYGPKQNLLHDPVMMELVIAASLGIFVLTTLVAYTLRYFGRVFRELNLSLPDPRHVLFVVVGTIPLSFCVSTLSLPCQWGWHTLLEVFPDLKIVDGLNSMDMVKDMAQTMPLFVMVVLFALTPAISEEIVFRGAVGRVLIANLGLWSGVILTSILFGLAHIHPVHALAVIPMGLAIHCLYLATRSFWMPMLLHFLNNAWASYAAQTNMSDPGQDGTEMTVLDLVEVGSAVLAVISLSMAFWQSRVRIFHADGTEWKSDRFPLRVAAAADVHRKSHSIRPVWWIAVAVFVIVCHLTVVIHLCQPPVPANEDGIQVRTNQFQRLLFQTGSETVA